MANIKEEASVFEPVERLTVADLDEVNVTEEVKYSTYEYEDKEVKYAYIERDGKEYRIPNPVLEQLKVNLEEKPEIEKFKVNVKGEGKKTKYTLIALWYGDYIFYFLL